LKNCEKDSREIKRLHKKNSDLIENVKRLSKEIDMQLSRHTTKKQESIKTEFTDSKIESELESLKSMINVLEKEIKLLKQKLQIRVDSMKVVEYEQKLTKSISNQAELLTQKRKRQLSIDQNAKILEKSHRERENGIPQFEEDKALKLFNNEFEKAQKLEQRLKIECDNIESKNKLIAEYEQKIKNLEKTVEKLKSDGRKICENSKKDNSDNKKPENIENLRKSFEELQKIYDLEVQSNTKLKSALENELRELKNTYKDSMKVLFYFKKYREI